MLVDTLQGVVGAIQITLVKETERLDVRLSKALLSDTSSNLTHVSIMPVTNTLETKHRLRIAWTE